MTAAHKPDPHGHDHRPVPVHGHAAASGCAHGHDHEHEHAQAREHAHDHDHDHSHAHDDCCGADAPVGIAPTPAIAGGLLLRVPAMDCAVEEAQVRRALEGLSGIRRLVFDLPARTVSVDAPRQDWDAVASAIGAAGFATQVLSAPPAAEDTRRAQRREVIRSGVALAIAAGAECVHLLAPATTEWRVTGMVLAAVAIGLSGFGVYRKGLASLLRGRLDISALMSVAVTGAFLIGQWPEAAMVMALYALAELIEARSVERARRAIASLLTLAPPQVEVRQADGRWTAVAPDTVAVGAIARAKPGERFALDGRVQAGQGAVDQSPITGESVPVDKAPGDEVWAGTINLTGALEFVVTRPASDSVLARIIHAVEAAQAKRAPTQRFVDRFAEVYTPAVFAIALAVAVGAPLLLGWAWLDAIYKALVLLVIACPCALVIATPVTVVSGLAAAARRGILIKGGVFLEDARRIVTVAVDKTGTITEGRPTLVAFEVIDGAAVDAVGEARDGTKVEATGDAGGDARDDTRHERSRAAVLRVAQALAARSDHPVSRAIAAGLPTDASAAPTVVEDFGAEHGRGAHGRIEGRVWRLCNHRWIEEQGLCSPELEARLAVHEQQGRTVTLLADDGRVRALFAVADTARATSRDAVKALANLGVRTVMLTGDNPTTAAAVAREVGVDHVHANLLPADKLAAIERLAADGPVAMVGDGINDGPALAAASLGIAMGGAGTDAAMEAADVLVMDDDLRKVPETIRLSRRTHAVLWQNIVLALGIKLVFLVLALFDGASMWMAVFADMGASLIVVVNGLRLLKGVPRD